MNILYLFAMMAFVVTAMGWADIGQLSETIIFQAISLEKDNPVRTENKALLVFKRWKNNLMVANVLGTPRTKNPEIIINYNDSVSVSFLIKY